MCQLIILFYISCFSDYQLNNYGRCQSKLPNLTDKQWQVIEKNWMAKNVNENYRIKSKMKVARMCRIIESRRVKIINYSQFIITLTPLLSLGEQ